MFSLSRKCSSHGSQEKYQQQVSWLCMALRQNNMTIDWYRGKLCSIKNMTTLEQILNAPDSQGNPPLHYALQNNNIPVAKFLMSFGAVLTPQLQKQFRKVCANLPGVYTNYSNDETSSKIRKYNSR